MSTYNSRAAVQSIMAIAESENSKPGRVTMPKVFLGVGIFDVIAMGVGIYFSLRFKEIIPAVIFSILALLGIFLIIGYFNQRIYYSADKFVSSNVVDRKNNLLASLLSILCLASCDGYHVVDVINRATTREVVYRTGNTLEDRTDSDGTTQTLNELVTDVTHLKIRNYQYISLTSYIRTWSLLGSYLRNESCIGLKLTIEMKLWELLLSDCYCVCHLVDDIYALTSLLVDSILSTTLCRETQHSNLRILNTCY